MESKPVTGLTFYRYRYALTYTGIAIFVAILLLFNLSALPPGISVGEGASITTSQHIMWQFSLPSLGADIASFFQQTSAIDLPYHILQKATLALFGLSPLGVRLPSVLIAAISAFLFFVLLHRLMRAHTAVVMSMLTVTSSWLIGIGRQGTPDIMIIFWTVSLLLLGTLISQNSPNKHLWKPLAVLALGLSLYTPYVGFLLVVAAIATAAQPHLRYLARYGDMAGTTLGLIFLAILLLPLGIAVAHDPRTLLALLSVPPVLPDPSAFAGNIVTAANALFNPFIVSFNGLPQPLVAIPIVVLAILSVYRLIIDWHSVRSHVLLVWLAVLIPLVGLGTVGNLAPLFVPIMLLAAIGFQEVIRYWYTIFPRNPYARIFGLLPLSLLVLAIIQFNYQRYFLAMPYSHDTVSLYNEDPFLLTNIVEAKAYQNQHIMLVVNPNDVALYATDQAVTKKLVVIGYDQFAATNNATAVIVAESAFERLSDTQRAALPASAPHFIVTDRAEDALRFRIFTL